MRGLPPVVAGGGHSSSQCMGLSLSRPLLLRSTSSRRSGSVVVAHGPSCSAVCGIFPDQGSNLCPLHWQADSQPLRHQGSPLIFILFYFLNNLNNDAMNILRKVLNREVIQSDQIHLFKKSCRASLVAQWLGICLPMQGTRVRALVWEDPTCRGATRPVSHNY